MSKGSYAALQREMLYAPEVLRGFAVMACLAVGLAATAGALSVLEQLWRRHGLGEDGLVWVMAEDLRLGVRTSPSARTVQEWKRGLLCCDIDGFAISESSLRSGAGARAARVALVGDGLFRVLHSKAVVGRSLERVSSLPGVDSVALATSAPPQSGVFFGEIALGTGGRGAVEPSAVGLVAVGPGYFGTLRQQVLAGRAFSEADTRNQMTVVISAATARHLGAHPQVAVGQRIRLGEETRQVIGVVENVRTAGLAQSLGGLLVYWPLDDYRDSMTILARVDLAHEPAFRHAALDLDRNVIVEPAPMRELLTKSLAELHFLTRLFALIALLAVALAVGGVYAVLSNLVVEQRAQIALRLAIGATREQVRRWVLWQGESRALVGLIVGIVLSYPFCRLFASHLYGVESGSIEARLAAAVLILAATAGGALAPAVRTSRLDPQEVLKGH